MTARQTSVIICTHNRADLLPGILERLRAQNYPSDAFEIVVVDNCSTDHTKTVVKKHIAESGVPVRYVVENRLGITFARNRGAEIARYPYLAYIDDDCMPEPDWLSCLIMGFDLHEDVVAVGGQVVLRWLHQEKPPWMSPKLELWLAANNYLGVVSQLLDEDERIIECNMALKRKAWQAAGGFLGMEQFGSHHMAASEVLYLLKQLHNQGGKIAYIPKAVVHHLVGGRSRRWMLQRAYWQGVSDAMLEHLLHEGSWITVASRVSHNLAALLALLGLMTASYLKGDTSNGFYHLMRSIRRVGLILGELRIEGDWHRVRSWISGKNATF
jgi:glycosyltransferase involved in cell wall biosynthesis